MQPIHGLHHITAVASDPQTNIDFYRNVLGQRLVKTTVNFDDPGTYHLYFGDHVGTPGSIMTFFPWRNMKSGQRGNGEAGATAYSVATDSIGFWQDYLKQQGINLEGIQQRFGANVLAFDDPDGLRLELVAQEDAPQVPFWEAGPIPQEHILRGFHSVTLWLSEVEPTAQLLTEHLGYQFVAQEGHRYRFQGDDEGIGLYIDLLHRPNQPAGHFGSGSVHHIAFRTQDDQEQLEYLAKLRQAGQRVTAVKDRQYFHSIYFRSPGGVLFEIATNPPGFDLDEEIQNLGESLKLPPWLEPHRSEIQDLLPAFELKPIGKPEPVEVLHA
jgi:glyoxalase family protein